MVQFMSRSYYDYYYWNGNNTTESYVIIIIIVRHGVDVQAVGGGRVAVLRGEEEDRALAWSERAREGGGFSSLRPAGNGCLTLDSRTPRLDAFCSTPPDLLPSLISSPPSPEKVRKGVVVGAPSKLFPSLFRAASSQQHPLCPCSRGFF